VKMKKPDVASYIVRDDTRGSSKSLTKCGDGGVRVT
jgi:hypothetical protein